MKTEVNTISEYLTTITPLPPYLPYPRFLLTENLSLTAKLLYTLLLDRATLSQKNSWVDERGFVYVIQMKIQVKQFAKKKIEALVKKDMQEWPPGCAGWMYQPKRPYVPEKHLQEKRK